MTARYELLLQSMRASSDAVLIVFVLAMSLLLTRWAIHRLMDSPVLPVFFKRVMYTAGDVLLIVPIYTLIIISK